MRRPLLISIAMLAGVLTVGCSERTGLTDPPISGPAFAPAETFTEVFIVEVDFTDFLVCTEEPVHWTGTIRIVDHSTTNRGVDPGLVQHQLDLETVRLTGVGETSGGTYTFRGTFNNILQSPDPVDPFPTTITLTIRDRVFGPDGGLLGIGMFSGKITINGAGETVIEDEDFTALCG